MHTSPAVSPVRAIVALTAGHGELPASLRGSVVEDGSLGPLLTAVEPLLAAAATQLRAAAARVQREHPGARLDVDAIVRDRMVALGRELHGQLGPTLALELQVARRQDELAGATPAARFADFTHQLRTPARRQRLFDEYPELGAQVATRIAAGTAAFVEYLERLGTDWDALADRFGGGSLGALCEIRGGGAPHRGGRAVIIGRHACGTHIVYKPRPLALLGHFQDLLGWLDGWGGPALHRLRLVERDGYGWVEYATAAPCADEAALERYYTRFGGYLALLYVLEGTDLHFETVVAAGEHPMLVDVETLFTPQIAGSREPTRSVLQLHLLRARAELPGAANLPTLRGARVDPVDHHRAILDGFAAMYRCLRVRRHRMPLHWFAADPIRVVLRATVEYDVLWRDSFHPDLLRDRAARDAHFDELQRAVAHRPELKMLIATEHRALRAGDVPLFETRVGSHNLAADGDETVPAYFARSGLEVAAGNLAALDNADLGQQTSMIRAALTLEPPRS